MCYRSSNCWIVITGGEKNEKKIWKNKHFSQSVIMLCLLRWFALIPSILTRQAGALDQIFAKQKKTNMTKLSKNHPHILGCPVISRCSAGQLSPQCEWARILLCVWKEAAVTLEELSDVSRRWHEVFFIWFFFSCSVQGLLLTLAGFPPRRLRLNWDFI